jgi:hypothetical protein
MPKWEKSLTIGILFFSFSLTLFSLSSKAAAVVFFSFSMLFLVRIVLDVVVGIVGHIHQKSAGTAPKASGVRESKKGQQYT